MVCVNRCAVIVFLSLLVTFAFGESFFYFEPFNTDYPPGQQPPGWYGPEGTGTGAGFLYGRDGVYNFSQRNSSVAYNGANVIFSGNLYTVATTDYLGTWIGSVIAYTNKLWTPTPYRPFGFEILRIEARIDPHNEGPAAVTNPESRRMAASMSIYLAEYADINNSSPAGTKFANQIVLYDMMRMHDNLSNDSRTTPYSQWGYWLSSYSRLQVTNVSSLDGSTFNLKPILEWNMDDNWVHLTNEGIHGVFSQYANPNSTNTNRIKIMVTHDGNVVQFFVNPDPANVNAYPNGMVKIGEVSPGFNNNIFPMIGVETIRYDTETQYLVIDDFYIRTIASAVTSEISPYEVSTNSNFTLNIFIRPTFGSIDDAGISEIHIRKPDSWTGFSWASYTNQLAVMLYSNNILVSTFSKQVGDVNPSFGSVALSIKSFSTSGDTLKIRFRATSWADNQIIRPFSTSDFTNKFVRIVISNINPLHIGNGEIEVYVDNPKYDDTWTDTTIGTAPRYATTGRMKSYSANALNVASIDPSLQDGDTLFLKLRNAPTAFGGILPNLVYQGTTNTFIYNISTVGVVDGTPITSIRIQVPPGFLVRSNTVIETNIESLLITNPVGSIRVTNEGGITNIYIEYWREGKFLPGSGGIDQIKIRTYGTPIAISNVFHDWNAYVNNRYIGGIENYWGLVNTNSTYPSRRVESRRPRANVTAWMTVQTNNVDYIENTSITNLYRYVLVNNGLTGNDIYFARIMLPSWITNVTSVNTTIPANVSRTTIGGTNYLVLNFDSVGTNLPAGTNVVVTFIGWDNVPPLTNDFTNEFPSWVDNKNGDGYVPTTVSPVGWRVRVITPPARGFAKITSPNEEDGDIPGTHLHHVHIDSNDVVVNMYIQNEGEPGNDIFVAYIYYPSDLITNVANFSSSKLGSASPHIYTTNISGSNFIVVNYDRAGNRLLSAQYDTVSFRIRYNVNAVTNVTLQVYIANSTNFARAVVCNPPYDGNQDIHFIYSRVRASNWVVIQDGFIDRASSTNLITFVITNLHSHPKNSIMYTKIRVPSFFSTNIYGINSSIMGNDASVVFFSYEGSDIVINVVYTNGIYGTYRDIITAYFVDHVNYSTNVSFYVSVSNRRGEMTNLYTNTVLVSDPPVNARYYVSNNVIIVSNYSASNNYFSILITNMGTGANEIAYARIPIPSPFQGLITNVVGSWTNLNYISWTPTEIRISYSNVWGDVFRGLPAGAFDLITIYITNKFSGVVTNTWVVEADNSPEFPPATNIPVLPGYDSNTYVVTPSMYRISPTSILASSTRVVFTNYVTAGAGYSIRRVRITIPYPFVTNNIYVYNSRPSTYTIGSNFVTVRYNTPMPQNQFDMIILSNVLNTFEEYYSTNSVWRVEVDYGDGKWFRGRDAVVDPSGTNVVDILYETAAAQSHVEPNVVGEDFSNYTYTFVVKNVGLPGNEIKEVTILPSAFITNITSVVSTIMGSSVTNPNIQISNGNIVVLRYYQMGRSIQAGSSDTITLVGWDNIDDTSSVGGITNSSWTIRVNNSPNPISYVNSDVTPGRSWTHTIERPNYRVDVYLEALNRISSDPGDYYKVFSTSEQTNELLYYVFNLGGAGNNLEKLFITIPTIGSIVVTNGMQVSSLYGGVVSISNQDIVVDYSSNPIIPGGSDVISIKFKDNLEEGETNIFWNSRSIFSTTAGKQKTNRVVVGKVNYLSFVMPMPSAVGYITSPQPKEIYTSDGIFNLTLVISNTGVDKNRIRGARINVPGFSILAVNSQNSTNRILGSSVFVYYTNDFNVSNTNYITLTLSNVFSSKTNLLFSGVVWNSKNTNTIVERNYSELSFKVEKLPSFYVVPNNVDTSYYFTNYSIYIKNDTTGVKDIVRVRLSLPRGIFLSLSNVTSTKVSSSAITTNGDANSITNILIDYSANEIPQGDEDVITFFGYDSLMVGNTNVSIKGYFDDGSGVWRELLVFLGYTNYISFVMPPAYMKAKIEPDIIYVTDYSNDFKFTVTNEGRGSNKLTKVRFSIPHGIVSISMISNRLGGIASNFVRGIFYEIWYSNDSGIGAGDYDEYYFTTATYYEMITNVSFVFMAGNEYAGPWYLGGIISGGSTMLRVQYPPLSVLGYVNKGRYIYTINTNAIIEYKIVNRSLDVFVTNVVINFDFTNFTLIGLDSNLKQSNSSVVIERVGNTIVARYPDGFFKFNMEDVITMTLNYQITNFYTIPMVGEVWVTGATNTNTQLTRPSGQSQIVYVTNAPFGRVIGYVTPYRYPVTVKQVSNDGSTMKDSKGDDIISVSSTSNGYFYLAEVYPDENNNAILVFEGPNYRLIKRVFRVERNKNNYIGYVYMLNKPFSKSSSSDQDIVSGSDNKSKVIVRAGNIQRDFSIDLYVTNLNEIQKLAIKNNDSIRKPSTYDDMKGYFLDIRGYSYEELINEIGISGDIILYLYYPSVVSNYYDNEDKLGIYYWKESTGDWIRLGGAVDKQNKFIVAKVSYLHRYYGIFESSKQSEGPIRNVTSSPRVFTPFVKGKDVDPIYGVAKISFEFDKPYKKYEVIIYNLEGRVVKHIVKEDPEGYVNGEIGWDGTDMDGKLVRNGVYIYRIKVEDKVYTGTIVLVK